jgi:hypothetical protein
MTTSTETAPDLLKFVPFSSCINPSFWYELNRIKLEDYKLNDDFKSLTGFFNICTYFIFIDCLFYLKKKLILNQKVQAMICLQL